jgi:hypothetical protein
MSSKKTEEVTFIVTPARAEYLRQCLERPLCLGCRREEDECDADPCLDKRIENGELAYCTDCREYYDPACIKDGVCDGCRSDPKVYIVNVRDTHEYSHYVIARSEDEAREVTRYCNEHDWEPLAQPHAVEDFGIVDRNIEVTQDDEKTPKQVEGKAVNAKDIWPIEKLTLS